MIFARIKRTGAETVKTIIYNAAGAALVDGYPVVWDVSTACDGVRVTKPATNTVSCFAGIVDQAIADGAYGRIQVFGYRSAANVINNVTADVAAGDVLVAVNAVWYLNREGDGAGGENGFIYYVGTSYTSVTQTTLSAAANKEVFIRAL